MAKIDRDDVLRPLEPIWQTKPVMADLIRARVEAVLDYAKASWRDGKNPALWRGNLKLLLTKSLQPVHLAAGLRRRSSCGGSVRMVAWARWSSPSWF